MPTSSIAAAAHAHGSPAESARSGDDFLVSPADRQRFRERGYVTFHHVISEAEIAALELLFDHVSAGRVPGMGRDFCDMSATYDTDPADFALINAMLPRHYLPTLQGNVYERISQSIARQLLGADMDLDYDQFLSKKPGKDRATFAMHQDMGYWPTNTPDTRTATCSLAITDSLAGNGCIRFVPGSQRAQALLPHRPKGADADADTNADRSESHTMELALPAAAEVVLEEVRRGGISVHDEWIVHGSAGNPSDRWRKTYVIAYRSRATVAHERAIGFTHSHNDSLAWRNAAPPLDRKP